MNYRRLLAGFFVGACFSRRIVDDYSPGKPGSYRANNGPNMRRMNPAATGGVIVWRYLDRVALFCRSLLQQANVDDYSPGKPGSYRANNGPNMRRMNPAATGGV
ncbi:MAG: hypothetical protein WD572_10940, partial [Gammaproteobacteria bacterium]